MDIEDAIYPSENLLQDYLDPDKRRSAVATFLKQITKSLRNVTTETDDFETLKLYWALRRLYLPPGHQKLSFEQKQKMTRAFAEGWPQFKEMPEIQELCARVKKYTSLLQDYGIHDYMVAKLFPRHAVVSSSAAADQDGGENGTVFETTAGSASPPSDSDRDSAIKEQDFHSHARRAAAPGSSTTGISSSSTSSNNSANIRAGLRYTLIHRALLLLSFSLICIPTTVLASPVLLLSNYVAKSKAKEALSRSNVKIAARDVMGSWKVLTAIALVPALHFLYTYFVYTTVNEAYGLLFFFFMPFVYFWSLLIGENVLRIARSMKPLFLILSSPSLVEELYFLRKDCVKRTVHAVDELGWGLKVINSASPNVSLIQE